MGGPYASSPRTPSGSTPGGGCGFLRITTSAGDGWAPHGARLRSQHGWFPPLAPAPVRQRLTQMLFLRPAVLVALAVAVTAWRAARADLVVAGAACPGAGAARLRRRRGRRLAVCGLVRHGARGRRRVVRLGVRGLRAVGRLPWA